MEVKVLRKFRDKTTGKVHYPGEVIDLKKERIDEIMAISTKIIKAEKAEKADKVEKTEAKQETKNETKKRKRGSSKS